VDRQAVGEIGQGVGWLVVLVSGGSALGLWIERLRECWVKELDGWVCWWVSGGFELGSVDRQAVGEMGQGFGWLDVLVFEWSV
jgi:hypothetical protein